MTGMPTSPTPSVAVGAAVMYLGVWMMLQPDYAWRCAQDLATGLQRFEGILRGQPWWSTPERQTGTPALSGVRLAGAVVTALGLAMLLAGLSRMA